MAQPVFYAEKHKKMADSGDGPKANTSANAAKLKPLSKEQILTKFQELRGQQRAAVNKMSEIEMDRKEHEWVAWFLSLFFLRETVN